jgi:hypothetical protein
LPAGSLLIVITIQYLTGITRCIFAWLEAGHFALIERPGGVHLTTILVTRATPAAPTGVPPK